jgi:type VI secretion system FHA domain protein
LETAGLDPASAQAVATEQLAEVFGEIMQIFVRGMMDVLKSRAEIKSEFRVPMTTIRPVENNPLKFCVDVRDALYSLFVKQGAGFLSPVEAFSEGFDDIKAHQLAMMAGMRAAFDSMMNRLDPTNLQKQFDQGMRRGAVFKPLNKMQYWQLYNEMYADITKDADENFQRLFGDVFAEAYEEQMHRLTAMRPR